MTAAPGMRDLASSLTYEAVAGRSRANGVRDLRVYEKLRQSLGELLESPVFSRSLSCVDAGRRTLPILAVRVSADGALQGWDRPGRD